MPKAHSGKKIRELVKEWKSRPCEDCGHSYGHWAMEFDHLPQYTKLFTISSAVRSGRYSDLEIMAEIRKTRLLCANCHANQTHARSLKKS